MRQTTQATIADTLELIHQHTLNSEKPLQVKQLEDASKQLEIIKQIEKILNQIEEKAMEQLETTYSTKKRRKRQKGKEYKSFWKHFKNLKFSN